MKNVFKGLLLACVLAITSFIFERAGFYFLSVFSLIMAGACIGRYSALNEVSKGFWPFNLD